MHLLRVLVSAVLVAVTHGKEVSVHIPPELSMTEPSRLYKKEGDDFSLSCSASGIPTPMVNWVKLGDQIYPEENATNVLNFVNFTKEHGGRYQCVASNDHGTTVSGYVNVDMIFLGDLKEENTTVKALEGEGRFVDCHSDKGGAVSNPEPLWSWHIQQNGSVLPLDSSRMAVDDKGRLHFAWVNVSDADEDLSFVCSAKNGLLGKTVSGSETFLMVTKVTGDITSKKPTLSYSNTNKATFHRVEVIKGQSVDLYCIFKGYPEFNVTWTKNRNGDPLPTDGITLAEGDYKLTVDSSKHTSGILLTCTATNIEGSADSLYDVNVIEPPVFIPGPKQLKSVNKSVGDEVYFQCEVAAKPSVMIEWLIDNKEVTIGNITDPRLTIDWNGNFHLKDLKKTDNQVVTCRATQTSGKKHQMTIFKSGYINVISPLNITKQPADVVVVGSFCDVVCLESQVEFDPIERPVITWYRNGEAVKEYRRQIYKAPNDSLIINATKYCYAEEIAGIYHYVATTTILNQRLESERSNVTLDPNGNFTRVWDSNGWGFLGLYLDPWWLWLLILIFLILFIILFILCICCCCCRRRRRYPGEAKKEEESSDLEVMLPQELPTKFDDPDIEALFKKYTIFMGDGNKTEEEDVTIMPQETFLHLMSRVWPVVPYLKLTDFETCYQSHCNAEEKGLSFQSFHSALNELINTNDARHRDALPSRRRKRMTNFHTKEKVIAMLKIVIDPHKEPKVFVNDLKFALRGLERLSFADGAPVVITTTDKVQTRIGYGNFWLQKITQLTWDLVQTTKNDETSHKERWSCDCGALHGMFNRNRWLYIRTLYEVMEFLNFAKHTGLYKSQTIQTNISDLRGILEEDYAHLKEKGFGERKRLRMQVYQRMATRIRDKFFRRFLWKATKNIPKTTV